MYFRRPAQGTALIFMLLPPSTLLFNFNFCNMNNQSYQREVENLSAQNDMNEFIKRYGGLKKVLVFVVYPLTSIIIGALTSAHLFVNFQNFITNQVISIFITICIALLLEVGKYHFSDVFFDGIRAGDYEIENRRGAFFLAALGMVVFMGLCVYFDFKGAPVVAEYVKKETAPPTLVNVDEINARFDARIAVEEAQSKRAAKMTWRGSIVEDGRKLLKEVQKNKATIEQQRSEAIAAAQAANDLTLAEFQEEHQTSGFWMRGIVSLCIVAQLICLWFIAIYNDAAKLELGVPASGGSPPQSRGAYFRPATTYSPAGSSAHTPTTPGGSAQHVATEPRRGIGFDLSVLQHTATPAAKTPEQTGGADYNKLNDDMLKKCWKDSKKWYDAYNSNRYKKRTREAKQSEMLAIMQEIELILNSRGVDVAKFLNIQTEEA